MIHHLQAIKSDRDFRWYAEAICVGVTVGFSEVLLAIYYGSMALDAVTLAVFMTVPASVGALAQAGFSQFKRYFKSATHLALVSSLIQVLGLGIMASALLVYGSNFTLMFSGQCLYWIGAMTSASPTQEILARSVNVAQHNRFFSRRAMLMTVLTLICNLSSSHFLSSGLTPALIGKFLIVAAISRVCSVVIIGYSRDLFTGAGKGILSKQRLISQSTNMDYHGIGDESIVSIVKLSLVMMVFRCAVNISSPFYSTYMLREIHLSFGVYSVLTAIPLVAKTICLTNWAKLLDDNRKFEGLAIATCAIGAVPVLWSLNASPQWLGVLQIISGLSWAGFDLISILLVQHMYPRSITQKLGLFMAFGSLGSVVGGLLGGYILRYLSNYHALFAISGALRLITGFGFLLYLRKNHLFRFQNLRLRSGLATIVTVRPSIEAAAKIWPIASRRDDRSKKSA